MPRVTLAGLEEAATILVQDEGLVIPQQADYQTAMLQAVRTFSQDVPNHRVFDHTVVTAGFRFKLFTISGAGSPIMPTTGLNAWLDGQTQITDIWLPYLVTNQTQIPLDTNLWRQVQDPDESQHLELLAITAAVGEVLRIRYTRPHVVGTTAATTSVPESYTEALGLLTAAKALLMASTRAVQNTGTPVLPADIVDRRSQAGEYAAAAKRYLEAYKTLVGAGTTADLRGASAVKDLDIGTQHWRGSLWHPTGIR